MELKTILVVDDDEDFRMTCVEVLELQGYRVVGVAHGGAALAWLRDNAPPQLILLDLMMPIVDGWEFLAAREREPSLAAVPVVVITASGLPAATPGAAAMLPKTADLADLIAVVRAHVRVDARGGIH